MEIIIGIIIGFFALKMFGGASGIAGVPGSSTVAGTAPPLGTPANPSNTFALLNAGYQQDSAIASSAISVGSTAATDALTALDAGSNVAKFVPVVGAIFSTIAGALISASKKRAQEAVSENQAVDAAIPAWDNTITQAVQLFNSGQITSDQFGQLLGSPLTAANFGIPIGIAWKNFWQEVGPQVQPGRNGCQSGTVPHASGDTSGTAFCGGAYGAGCCVAYEDFDNSMGNKNQDCLFLALQKAIASPGTPFTATINRIYPSKYSSYSRAAYTVTLEAPLH